MRNILFFHLKINIFLNKRHSYINEHILDITLVTNLRCSTLHLYPTLYTKNKTNIASGTYYSIHENIIKLYLQV